MLRYLYMNYTFYSFLADAVLALVVLLGILIGYKRGFVRTVAKPVKLIASLIIAFSFASQAGAAWIHPALAAPVRTHMTEFLTEKCADITAATAQEQLPTVLKMAAGMFGIDVTAVAEGAGSEGIITALVDALTTPLVSFISMILAFIALYILSQFALSLLFWLIDTVFQGGVIGFANHLLGLVLGAVFAVLVAWGLVALSDFIFQLEATQEVTVFPQIEQGFFYRLLNTYNPVDLLLSF